MGKIKDADGIGQVGNPTCVLPDTLIYKNSGVTKINSLTKNDRVLGHTGKYHKIERIYKRKYKGKMFSILVHNLGKIVITPEHSILALKTSKFRYKFKSYQKYLPLWYSVEELEKGDVLLYPIPKETFDVKSIKLDIKKPKWDFKSKALPEEIKINNSFLRLAGYYLSEGYARTDKCKGTVGFAFNSKETDYIDDVISIMRRIFKINPAKLQTQHNATRISFYSARLARFFEKLFGKGAKNKHIPHWMSLLPIKKQGHLIAGLWRGDGYINNHTAKYDTISNQLAHQLRILLLRQKIIFSFLTVPAKGMHKKNYHIYVKDSPSLRKLAKIVGIRINFSKRGNLHKSWLDDKYYYVPIRKINSINYRGPVYNLEVENSHSYVSNCATLHNCGDIMTIYIKVKDDKISQIGFETLGCAVAIAVSSMLTEMAKGKTLDEALKIDPKSILDVAGDVPPVKSHCAVIGSQALHKAIEDYRSKVKS